MSTRTVAGLLMALLIVVVLVWYMASNWQKEQPRSWFGVAETAAEAAG